MGILLLHLPLQHQGVFLRHHLIMHYLSSWPVVLWPPVYQHEVPMERVPFTAISLAPNPELGTVELTK